MPWSVADSLSTGPARNGKQPARTFLQKVLASYDNQYKAVASFNNWHG